MLSLKAFACIALTLTVSSAGYCQVWDESFETTYWFADAVVVGTVVKVNDETFDFEVQEWMRARGCPSSKIIRANRYAIRTDVPPDIPVPLAAGSRYVLLLRKPYDEGAGENPYWLVLQQVDLAVPSICLIEQNGLRVSEQQLGCPQPIKLTKFLDALRSFDSCFELYDDPIKGTYPSGMKCSGKAIQAWEKRSALHGALANASLRSMERRSPR